MNRIICLIIIALATIPVHSIADEPDLLPRTLEITFEYHGRTIATTTITSRFELGVESELVENHNGGEVISSMISVDAEVEGNVFHNKNDDLYTVVCKGHFTVEQVENMGNDSEILSSQIGSRIEFDSSARVPIGQSVTIARQDGDKLNLRIELVE